MCDYKLPGWPSTNINWDVESMSHTANAVEAAGHWESGGCSGWETCPSASLPVQSNTHFCYTNTHTHACTQARTHARTQKKTHMHTYSKSGWIKWSRTLPGHLVLWPLTFRTPLHPLSWWGWWMVVGVEGHPLLMPPSSASCRLTGNCLSRNLSICDFVCLFRNKVQVIWQHHFWSSHALKKQQHKVKSSQYCWTIAAR